MSPRRYPISLVASVALGLTAGYACYRGAPDPANQQALAGGFAAVSDLFLRLVRMLMAPMILVSIVAGIAGMDWISAVRRIGLRAAFWFAAASMLSVSAGFAGYLLLPGAIPTSLGFVQHTVPRSVFEALALGGTLQIAVFAVLFGVALASVKGTLSNILLGAVDEVVIVMVRLTDLVMKLAPVAAFAATASITATHGFEMIGTYCSFVGGVFAGLLILSTAACLGTWAVLGRAAWVVLRRLREPVLLGFATASSEAAYPRLMEQMDEHGIPSRVTGMVLPLAFTFNLCGSMAYQTFAVLFLADFYHVQLSPADQLMVLGLVMLFSKGMAGVPRASIVMLAVVMPMVGIPAEASVLLLAIDQVVDMGRTAVNVLCNGLVTALIAQGEIRVRPPVAATGPATRPAYSNEVFPNEPAIVLARLTTPIAAR